MQIRNPETLAAVERLGQVTATVNIQEIARQAATEPHKLSLSPPTQQPGSTATATRPMKRPAIGPRRASGSGSECGAAKASGKPSKYRSRKFTIDGVTWDSKKELARWRVLYDRFRAGRIKDLR